MKTKKLIRKTFEAIRHRDTETLKRLYRLTIQKSLKNKKTQVLD
jgi:hypothetical protein